MSQERRKYKYFYRGKRIATNKVNMAQAQLLWSCQSIQILQASKPRNHLGPRSFFLKRSFITKKNSLRIALYLRQTYKDSFMPSASKSFKHNVWQLIFVPAIAIALLLSISLVSFCLYELSKYARNCHDPQNRALDLHTDYSKR